MRLVIDTNVVVAGTRSSGGASAVLLDMALTGRVTLLLSATLAYEYEAVLKRQNQRDASGLTFPQIDALIDALVVVCEPIQPVLVIRPTLPDPDDDFIFELAVSGQADALVTFERGTFDAACEAAGIAVLTPRDVLQRMVL